MNGSKAYQWGVYEGMRLWGTLWPMLIGLAASLLTQLSMDVSSDVSVPLGLAIGLSAKALQQWGTDNTGKSL